MAHNNPYAWAITPRQIIFRLGCAEQDKERIQNERVLFAIYCADMASRGVFCKNQLEAWENYESNNPFIKPIPDFVLPNEPQESLTWDVEWLRDSLRRAQFGNYSDTGGQQ